MSGLGSLHHPWWALPVKQQKGAFADVSPLLTDNGLLCKLPVETLYSWLNVVLSRANVLFSPTNTDLLSEVS